MTRTRWPVFPVLLSVYPVLAFYAANADFFYHWRYLIWPIVLSVGLVGGVMAGVLFVTRSGTQAAVAGTLAALWFPHYAALEQTIVLLGSRVGLESAAWAGELSLALALGLFLLARHGAAHLQRVVPALNVATVVLCLFPLVSIFQARQLPHVPPIALTEGDSSASVGLRDAHRPSIVLIVLDMYTGATSLRRNWGFDNTPFLDSLRRAGFMIPDRVHSNYMYTFLSVASLLNSSYLEEALAEVDQSDKRWAPAFGLARDNAVARILRKAGYRYVVIPSYFGSTTEAVGADAVIRPPWGERSVLESRWQWYTGMRYWFTRVCRIRDCTPTHRRDPHHPVALEWRFEALRSLPLDRTPHFVVAHLVLPHDPYVFGPSCEHRWPGWVLRAATDSLIEQRLHLEQLQCVNRRLLALVRAWDSASINPAPIVLLQSDHGHGRIWGRIPTLAQVHEAKVLERFDVFAAYRVPEDDVAAYRRVRSPVNLLRVLLDRELGLRLPLLPDRFFWTSRELPYQRLPVPPLIGMHGSE